MKRQQVRLRAKEFAKSRERSVVVAAAAVAALSFCGSSNAGRQQMDVDDAFMEGRNDEDEDEDVDEDEGFGGVGPVLVVGGGPGWRVGRRVACGARADAARVLGATAAWANGGLMLTAARGWWWLWLWLWLVEVVVEVVKVTLLVRRGESSCLAAGWRVGGRGRGRAVGWCEDELCCVGVVCRAP